ncbi:hypothetical protein [Streptomyces sp. NPDC029674]|uniref:hypothetical protein n=1 Tax=Streptomyces sp. NPDC029674 TaxID=3365297 RepID=UPI00384B6194
MSSERSVHEAAEPQRRRSRLAVASVAATVLLIGGGGAYFASTASGGGSGGGDGAPAGAGGEPPPLALDGYPAADRQDDGAKGTGGTSDIAPGEPDPSGATYRATGDLPKGPESAAVYHARGEVTRGEVARLAEALGVTGTPTSRDGVWKVGADNDGSGPSLQVNKQAPGTWTYARHGIGGTDNCSKGKPCSSTSTAPNGDPGDAVSEKAAKDAAAPVLKALGQDDAKLDARQLMGAVRVVNADPKIGGLPTYGWSTGVQVGAGGEVVGGSGQLKAPDKGATYPVIGARETLDQLNTTSDGHGRIGIGGCATPVPHMDDSTKTEGGGGAKQAPCEPSSTAPKPRPVAVEGATFGLATHFVDGRQTLVPSWLFEVKPQGARDTFTVTHPAIAPKYLTSPSTPGTPTPTGKPGKGDTGDKGGTDKARVESYTADGKSLTVHFWGGACSEYSASAREDGDRVTVTVTETGRKGDVCIMVAKELKETVTLDEPLGDRKVVDAGGETVKRK